VWFDSHCHLHLCEGATPHELTAAARDAGVDGLVTIGIDLESSRRALAIARDLGMWGSAGLHPNQADEWNDKTAADIGELVGAGECVAVGETGLDFYRMGAPREVQEVAFEAHIELAKELGKALVIHTRESCSAALDLLEDGGPPPRLVFHCWSGDKGELARALELGAYISFAGNVSFNSAGSLREAAAAVPGDRLLVETDSPFLSPERGRPNVPANVVLVGRAVAQARGENENDLARTTTANARTLFQL
jgi:TatD DNase family protein